MKKIATFVLGAVIAASAPPATATPVATGYRVRQIDLPDIATGDVVTAGNSLFVGVGAFDFANGGTQSVVRVDSDGQVTTVATGFSGLAGFAWDAVGNRLIVADNHTDGTTGNTIFEIPDALNLVAPLAAGVSLELLPSGSIPGAADITLVPGDPTTLFVNDASENFPATGELLKVDIGPTPSSISFLSISLAHFAAGLASDGNTLWVGDGVSFPVVGQISSVDLGSPTPALLPLVGNLAGQFDIEFASDGSLLTTGDQFVLRVDPLTGAVSTIASGFSFSAGLAERNGTIYVIEGGFGLAEGNPLYEFIPVPEPGGFVLVAAGLLGLVAASRRISRGED